MQSSVDEDLRVEVFRACDAFVGGDNDDTSFVEDFVNVIDVILGFVDTLSFYPLLLRGH